MCRIKLEDQTIFTHPEPIKTLKFAFEITDVSVPERILERRELIEVIKYSLANGLFQFFVGLLSGSREADGPGLFGHHP